MKYYGKEMETEHPTDCVALTWEDAEKAEKENEECGWSFGTPELLRMVTKHMVANNAAEYGINLHDNYREMEYIEWRLEDANFHFISASLADREYDKVLLHIAGMQERIYNEILKND